MTNQLMDNNLYVLSGILIEIFMYFLEYW